MYIDRTDKQYGAYTSIIQTDKTGLVHHSHRGTSSSLNMVPSRQKDKIGLYIFHTWRRKYRDHTSDHHREKNTTESMTRKTITHTQNRACAEETLHDCDNQECARRAITQKEQSEGRVERKACMSTGSHSRCQCSRNRCCVCFNCSKGALKANHIDPSYENACVYCFACPT